MIARLYHEIEERRALLAWEFATRGDEVLEQAPAIASRQRDRCYLCDGPWVGGRRRPKLNALKSRTRDHVFPKARGGDGKANILLAHDDCNQAKGDRWPTPCEVIYLAAIYATPVNHQMRRALRLARLRSAERHTHVEALLA